MITWIIIWIIILLSFCLLAAMEIVNGTINSRFWVCVALLMLIIIIPIFVISSYRESCIFYNDFIDFNNKMVKSDDYSLEYKELGRAINYNYALYTYQNKFHKMGIFAPYTRNIKTLKPLQFKYFDISKYVWWET